MSATVAGIVFVGRLRPALHAEPYLQRPDHRWDEAGSRWVIYARHGAWQGVTYVEPFAVEQLGPVDLVAYTVNSLVETIKGAQDAVIESLRERQGAGR